MNTPAHLIFAATAFAKPHQPLRNGAALAGGLAPDLSLYFLTFWSIAIQGISPRVVFDELYFSPEWQQIFAIDNSFFLWGGALALGAVMRAPNLMVFAGAGLLHLGLDFPFHHDDGRPHFWPLTMWVFESPFSYWDRRHHGGLIGGAEFVACLICLVYLWRRFSGRPARVAVIGGAFVLAGPGVLFGFLF